MKQKDLALILVIGFVSAVFALILSNMFISSPKNRQEKVEVIGSIGSDFPTPDKKYFNVDSINPTQLIEIDKNENESPFEND